jgi:hypothetical protein
MKVVAWFSAALCVVGSLACGGDEVPTWNQGLTPQPPTAGVAAGGAGGVPAAGAAAGVGGAVGSVASGGSPGMAGASAASSAPTVAGSAAGDVGGASGQPAAGGGSGGAGAAAPVPTEKFSFFITSLQGMRDLSKSQDGFGGDLRYGEATGLAGADKICTELAERSMPGAAGKGWRAFLSTAKGGMDGGPTHAKDRIGTGPWYDRTGRLVAMDLSALLQERPAGADPAIANDLPNERGEPNHTDTVEGMDDNHDVVTGTNAQGMWNGSMTCEDWTSLETPMPMPMPMGEAGSGGGLFPGFGQAPMLYGPGVGHSWPSDFSGMSWLASHSAPGCGAGVQLVQDGAGMGTGIGNAGGYGGLYCFALMP